MEVIRQRNPLVRTQEALERGKLTLGFIGGSITDARPRHNWPEPVIAWFVERYPNVKVAVENAAIGATGSECAVFRVERDLIERGCDLVFIDYAVNDYGEPEDKRMRSREGLIRKLLASGKCDVALVYTYNQSMYEDMMNGRMPLSIADFEQLAERYGVGSVWMGLHALEEVKKGRMRWEEWLPDGLHPTSRGSLSYGQSVIAYLERELPAGSVGEAMSPVDRALRTGAGSGGATATDQALRTVGGQGGTAAAGQASQGSRHRAVGVLPEPVHPGHWQHAYAFDLDRVETHGPWTIRRWPHLEWIERVLHTSAVGATMSFTFTGQSLTLGFDFGKMSADYRWRLDGGEWQDVRRDRPDWVGDHGWYHTTTMAQGLEPKEHRVDIEVVHGNSPGCKGTHFNLALIGIVP